MDGVDSSIMMLYTHLDEIRTLKVLEKTEHFAFSLEWYVMCDSCLKKILSGKKCYIFSSHQHYRSNRRGMDEKKDFTLQPTALTGDEPSTGVGLKRLLGCRLKLCIVYRRKVCGFFVL
jgi:hypothetical protein